MRTRAFFFLILWSAGPSEASRHFSQDRQLRAKFFVAQPSWLRSRWASRLLLEFLQVQPAGHTGKMPVLLTRCEREAPLCRRLCPAVRGCFGDRLRRGSQF